MNRKILLEFISEYKKQFENVNQQEIYKWRAVKCFQDNWNIEAENFHEMMRDSFQLTKNLLVSGKYFPLAMLLHYSDQRPEEIRNMFRKLFDEEKNLYDRINEFQNEIEIINTELYPEDNSYQDHRAIIAYLTLRFPDRYYLYKFKMFKDVSLKLGYSFQPVKGRIENLGQYLSFCDLVRNEILLDQELLKIHKNRIGEDCYFDERFYILTQDVIYAINIHLSINVPPEREDTIENNLIELSSLEVLNTDTSLNFKGQIINFIQNNIDNKRIGDLGELWVLEREKSKLNHLSNSKLIEKIKHTSKEVGDGTGYDIESVDKEGNKIYIEVKTTKGHRNTPFYITRNELERSIIEKERYYLYRVYNFNVDGNTADLLIIKGELTNLCNFPTNFKVNLTDS
jgi:Domain of unknown function (DUF3883)